jgi:hypothetical protein
MIMELFWFEFLLVLNHDEETWDCPKGEVLENRNISRHNFGEK